MCDYKVKTVGSEVSEGADSPMKPTIRTCRQFWNSHYLETSMEEWIMYLKHQNSRIAQLKSTKLMVWYWQTPNGKGFIITPVMAAVVERWCQQLKLPFTVWQRAITMYERFFITHLVNMATPGNRMSPSGHVLEADICTKIRHQSLLHLISCFQIASKLEDSYTAVTVPYASFLMREANRPCDHSTIVRSEVLVLSTLQYDINFAPLSEYIDVLLSSLVVRQEKTEKSQLLVSVIDPIRDACMNFVRLFYLNQQVIVEHIAYAFSRHLDDGGKVLYARELERVQRNQMLLATGIITAASYLVCRDTTMYFMRDLHPQTGVQPKDMAVVSSSFIAFLEDNATG